jgi:hypothetical protein
LIEWSWCFDESGQAASEAGEMSVAHSASCGLTELRLKEPALAADMIRIFFYVAPTGLDYFIRAFNPGPDALGY